MVPSLGPKAVIEPSIDTAPERPIGEVLVADGVLEETTLAQALTGQPTTGRRLGTLLLESHLITADQLTAALSRQLGIPRIDLRKVKASPEALAMVSESVARSLEIVPVRLREGVLSVVAVDPRDPRVVSTLEALPVATVRLGLASSPEVSECLNASYKALAGIDQFVGGFQAAAVRAAAVTAAVLPVGGADAPVVEVVNRIVTQALRDRASDIHVEPTPDFVRVRYRIDGTLNEVLKLPASIGPAIVSRLKIMADMNIVEKRRPQDGQFQMVIDSRELDVRVSTTATIFGEKAVLRLLDKTRGTFNLMDLGMPNDIRARYDTIVHSPFGMVIVAGPTGAGKTTTLYATLAQIASPELNVMTIEDPVEYVFPNINQIEINVQAEVTFAAGLRSILRQDPDIILVGEVRDAETARIAVQSALTGHLVLSSIHSTDATSALYRLLDMGIEAFLVASALTGVVAQRLVRRTCSECAEEYLPLPHELAYYRESGGDDSVKFLKGAGCVYCVGTGYRGRLGVYEILTVTDELRQLLVIGASPQDVRELAIKGGMRTLRDEAVRLVGAGATTISEVMRTIYTLGAVA